MSTKNVPIVYLTRIEKFSSAHRLFNKSWDDETNTNVFGKCNNVHGHNYTVEVTVKGTIDHKTGMVINIVELKSIIDETIFQLLDHKNIDQDVSFFRDNNVPSTSENVCVFIWNKINEMLPSGVEMHRIKLHETDKNIVEFYGEHLSQ